MIKIKIKYIWLHTGSGQNGRRPYLAMSAEVYVDDFSKRIWSERGYGSIIRYFSRDYYPAGSPEFAIKVLSCIDRLKSDTLGHDETDEAKTLLGSLKSLFKKEEPDSICKEDHCEWNGETHMHYIYKDRVRLEPQGWSYQDDWPTWECPLSHYEAALRGWLEFIQMPVDENTELTIELPDEPDWPENGRFIDTNKDE
jgi:hypothetical protein